MHRELEENEGAFALLQSWRFLLVARSGRDPQDLFCGPCEQQDLLLSSRKCTPKVRRAAASAVGCGP